MQGTLITLAIFGIVLYLAVMVIFYDIGVHFKRKEQSQRNYSNVNCKILAKAAIWPVFVTYQIATGSLPYR
jgi:hypothetical protein